MTSIDDIISRMDGSSIEKKFYSKKNQVYLANTKEWGRCVVKIYTETRGFCNEAGMLTRLKSRNVRVPGIYRKDRDYIVMEYIDGETLVDRMCSLESRCRDAGSLVYELANWLKAFYQASCESGRFTILYDVNFRNFIISSSIFGIDFEDSQPGCIEEDIGRLCAFLITYTPEFTDWKMKTAAKMMGGMVHVLNINRERAMEELHKELDMISIRRKIIIPEDISI